jgi:acyl-CoA thioesterase-1
LKHIAAVLFLLTALGASAAAKTAHIVAFGDSATYGYLVTCDKAYPAQLEAALRRKGYDVTVRNAGVNGDTTRGALRRLDAAIDPGTDMAIVEFGVNDIRLGDTIASVRSCMTTILRA